MSEHTIWWIESEVIHVPNGRGGARHGNFDELKDAQQAVCAVNSHAGLLKALEGLLARYLSLVTSGDCGDWDAEKEEPVKLARAALNEVTHAPV